MMHHSRALILKKEAWGESGWRLTALTAEFGKIRLLAQGARKHGAKLQGHLEPGSVTELSFVTGRGGWRLTTARLAFFPVSTRASFAKLQSLAVILATLDANLLEERDRAAELLRMTEDAIGALEAGEDAASARLLGMWFQARFTAFLGLFPSPVSPEGRSIPQLRSLLARAPDALRLGEFDPGVLERELSWLLQRTGGALISVGPVSSAVSRI